MIFAKEYVRGLGKDSFLISQVSEKKAAVPGLAAFCDLILEK